MVVQIHPTQLMVDDTHVAQPVERATVNRISGGSNPSVGVRFARGWRVESREETIPSPFYFLRSPFSRSAALVI